MSPSRDNTDGESRDYCRMAAQRCKEQCGADRCKVYSRGFEAAESASTCGLRNPQTATLTRGGRAKEGPNVVTTSDETGVVLCYYTQEHCFDARQIKIAQEPVRHPRLKACSMSVSLTSKTKAPEAAPDGSSTPTNF